MNSKLTYVLLAIIGGVVPYIFFISFLMENGFDLAAFVQGLFANGAAAGFTADLVISSITFWLVAFELHRRDNGPSPWGFIAMNLLIGLSFALPLYVLVREVQRETTAA